MEFDYEKPLVVSIMNKGEKEDVFIPYRENMRFPLKQYEKITFGELESEEAIYYVGQTRDNIVAKIKSQGDETDVILGNYDSATGDYTIGASYTVFETDTTKVTEGEDTTTTINYKVYGTLPYKAQDTTLGNPAGNVFTIKIKDSVITERADLPSGNIAKTEIGGVTRQYAKANFEDDGTLISVVVVGENKTLKTTIKWEDNETYIYNFDFSEVKLGAEDETVDNVRDIVITLPSNITLTNNGENTVGFIPYKENMEEFIKSNDSITLTVETASQAMYYLLQADENLGITL